MNKSKYKLIFLISGILILNGLLFSQEIFYLIFLPVFVATLYFLFFYFERTFLFTLFLIPLSVLVSNYFKTPVDISLPSEFVLIVILFIYIFKQINGEINNDIYKHPVSKIILLYLLWTFITALTSTEVLVSLKFFLSRCWLVIAFYFVSLIIFKKKENATKYIWYYTIGLVIVIIVTLFKHAQYGLTNQKVSNWIMSPFYNDHTSYGAAIAFILPVIIGLLFLKSTFWTERLIKLLIITVLILGIIFSYTRAAWLSIAIALIVFFILYFKISFKVITLTTLVSIIITFVFWNTIVDTLSQNNTDSSSDFSSHIKSMTNIRTDDSNVERINRWSCAIKMFAEKPVFGWGPGTYMFKYAPYQLSVNRTSISTDFGEVGNAHSEYLGSLAETGLPGMLLYILILIFTSIAAVKNYKNKFLDPKLKYLSLFVFIGLITYFFHGMLNNFLDTDKIASLFWGFIAIIVSINFLITHESKVKNQEPRV